MQTMLKARVSTFASTSSARKAFSSARPSQSATRPSTAMSAVKLYTNPGSRGKMPEWYLAELGNVPFEAINLDMKSRQHKTADYLAIHPFGQVPAMTDGDLKLFESGAILLHLAQKYGGVSGDALSTACVWCMYANATLSDALFGPRKAEQTPVMLNVLNGLLAKTKYIAGNEFTVSDVAIGSYLLYLPLFFPDQDLSKYKNVLAYMKTVSARPACPDAYKQGMQGK